MASIGSLVIDLVLSSAGFETDLKRQSNKIKKQAEAIGREVAKVGKTVALAAAAAATGFAVMVKSQIDAADHLRDLSQATGVGVDALSELELAAQLSGATLDDLTKGFRKLSAAAAESANPASASAKAFAALGISATNADHSLKGSEELLLEVSDAFSKYADGAGKAAIAQQLLGRASTALIPLLNQGAAAIEAYKERAREMGLTITQETADAADKFNDNLTILKSTFLALTRQVMAQLLPTLVGLTDAFVKFASDGDAVKRMADDLIVVFKALATYTIGWKITLEIVIGSLRALFEAAKKVREGLSVADFASPVTALYKMAKNAVNAGDSFKQLGEDFGDISDQVNKDMDVIEGLWNGFDETLQEVTVTAQKIKPELKFFDPATLKGIATATKTLEEFRQGLVEQVATFGMTEAAVTKYRLEVGDLSDEVKKAGAAGEKMKAGIVALAEFKQAQEDGKALADAIAEVNIQLDELAGKNVDSALAAFDKQNAELRKTIARSGTAADKEKLDSLRALIGAQAEYNKLQDDAARVQSDLAIQEQRISNNQQAGVTTELDAMAQLDEARTKALEQLTAIHTAQAAIAEQSGNPALIENAQKFGAELENLAAQTDLLAQKLRSGFEEAGTNALADFIEGTRSASDAFGDFMKDIERQITQLVSKQLVQKFFNMLSGDAEPVAGATGGSGGGGGFDIFKSIAGLFGGGRAYGGAADAGTMYRVNEREQEFFKPNVSGKVIPLSQMGSTGGQVTQNINVKGDVTAKSAQQLAVETARRQRVASSRLG